MASVEECREAVDGLVATLAAVEPQLRAKHVPRRTLACVISDLDLVFVGRLDEHGCHDIAENPEGTVEVDVRITLESDELVSLSSGSDDFLHAWLRGRVQVSASMRDLLRLRTLFGL